MDKTSEVRFQRVGTTLTIFVWEREEFQRLMLRASLARRRSRSPFSKMD